MGAATSVALNEDEARVVYRELRREYAEQYASRAMTPGEQKQMLARHYCRRRMRTRQGKVGKTAKK